MNLLILSLRDIDNTAELSSSYNTHIRGSNTWAKIRAKRQSPRVTVPAKRLNVFVKCQGQPLVIVPLASISKMSELQMRKVYALLILTSTYRKRK